MIYFDNAATTKTRPELIDLAVRLNNEYFANPSSNHALGHEAKRIYEQARKQILAHFNGDFKLVFTSGATEANNLFIKGVALKYKNRGKKLITTVGEHPSVLNAFKQLEEEFGFHVTYLPLLEDGSVDPNELIKSIDDQTILVSIMHVNNEVGAINDLAMLSKIIKTFPKCFFHSDVTQSIGKIKIPYQLIDAFSFSAHKIHGFKGSGALILREKIDLLPLLSGGSHECHVRAGTEAFIPNILLAKTLRLALENEAKSYRHVEALVSYLRAKLALNNEIIINSPVNACPFVLNFSLVNIKSSIVVEALSNAGIMVSSNSACDDKLASHSETVYAMYHDLKRSQNTVRISLGEENTLAEVDHFIEVLNNILESVKK